MVSADGLIIERVLSGGADSDAIAALATTLARHGAELGTAAGLGDLGVSVLEYQAGPVIIRSLADGAALVVLVDGASDFGEVLYVVRRHSHAIAAEL